MTKIYDQHDAAFSRVSAYAILDETGRYVARVNVKFPADGAGRLYAYTHWIGDPMTRGHAGGGGYDKTSTAIQAGFAKAVSGQDAARPMWRFYKALTKNDGHSWSGNLESEGFRVLNVI